MGTKKITKNKLQEEPTMKGGDNKVTKKDDKVVEEKVIVEEVVEEKAEVKVEEPVAEAPKVEETPAAEAPAPEAPVVPAPEVPAEVKPEEAVEVKAEEAAEDSEKVEKKKKDEPKVEEVPVVEPPVAEVAPEAPKAEEPKPEVSPNVVIKEVSDKPEDLLKTIADSFTKLNEKLDAILAKAAPVAGVPDAEEAPKAEEEPKTEVPVEVPAEEPKPAPVETPAAPAEEPKVEVKEEVTKTDTPTRGPEDLLAEFKSIKDRLEKLESSPAPSKAVAFARGFGVQNAADDELTKIESRLEEITKIRETDPEGYSRSTALVDEAFTLIKRRRELKGA